MKLFLLLALLSPLITAGQVDLLIEDERGEKFLIGIDGFVQNEHATGTLLVKGLDTTQHLILVKSGTQSFQRSIKIREKGLHRYVIITDFHGNPKLRYRGKASKTPTGITPIALASSIPWPEEYHVGAVKEKPDIVTTTPVSVVQMDTIRPDTAIVVSAVATGTAVVATSVPVAEVKSDSVEKAETVSSEIPSENESPGQVSESNFTEFMTKLRAQEFEFERMQMCENFETGKKITAQQLGEMFQVLQYDRSRMQLTRAMANRVSDPENLPPLSRLFEYEITKSQYILFLE